MSCLWVWYFHQLNVGLLYIDFPLHGGHLFHVDLRGKNHLHHAHLRMNPVELFFVRSRLRRFKGFGWWWTTKWFVLVQFAEKTNVPNHHSMYYVCSGSEASTVYFFRRIVNRDPIVQAKLEGIYLKMSFVDKNIQQHLRHLLLNSKKHTYTSYTYTVTVYIFGILFHLSIPIQKNRTHQPLSKNSSEEQFQYGPAVSFFKNSHTFQNANHKGHSSSRTSPGLVIHHGEPYRDPQENLLEQRGWQNPLW